MANLERGWRWEKYIPDIGNNRELEKPFFLWVASGLTIEEFKAFHDRVGAFSADDPQGAAKAMVGIFGPLVRMGDEPLFVAGAQIPDLETYFRVISEALGAALWIELVEAIKWHNSFDGVRALFYERLSGGTVFTTSRNTGKPAS